MIARLIDCNESTKVRIKRINGGRGAKQNLFSSGLKIDDTITIMHKPESKGPITVSFNRDVVDIGRQLAIKIIVETEQEIVKNLSEFCVGDIVEIIRNNSVGEVRSRLLDMGIVKGERLEVIRLAPLGDPIEIRVNKFDLTLRLKEAEKIEAKLIDIKKISREISWGHLSRFKPFAKS